jgi:hypothetical protein
MVEAIMVENYLGELVGRCGNKRMAASYSLVSVSTIDNILRHQTAWIQSTTARRILLALEHKREEDRFAAENMKRRRAVRTS